MIAIFIMVVTAVVLGSALVLAARGHASSIRSIEQLTTLSRPVDLEAFNNLTSLSEEEYLRNALPARQFRRVQRARLRAMLDYVNRAAHNSAILLRLGETGRKSPNLQLAKAGEELASSALQMRLLCLFAMAVILMRIVVPQLRLSTGAIGESYASTRERVLAFGRIEQPAFSSRFESAL